jgi:hypothetical protein
MLCITDILFCIFACFHSYYISYFAYSFAYSFEFFTYCSELHNMFHCLLPLLFGSPSQAPAVDVSPPITVTAVHCFITDSHCCPLFYHRCCFITIRGLSLHVERYRPCFAHWNQRKESQHAGYWNGIQHLCSLFSLFRHVPFQHRNKSTPVLLYPTVIIPVSVSV